MKRDLINQALFTGETIFNSGTSDGAEKGWETKRGTHHEILDARASIDRTFSHQIKPSKYGLDVYTPVNERAAYYDLPSWKVSANNGTYLSLVPKESVSNRSVWPTIFLSNKAMPESLTKANAVRRGASALDSLKNGSPPVGFSGQIHPLSDDAETATKAAVVADDTESHHVAAAAHEKAAGKMSGFMREVSKGKHPNRDRQIAGISATHEHHMKRAEAHRDRAAYLDNEASKAEAEKALTKGKKSGKK